MPQAAAAAGPAIAVRVALASGKMNPAADWVVAERRQPEFHKQLTAS